jgi:hypothetical protein
LTFNDHVLCSLCFTTLDDFHACEADAGDGANGDYSSDDESDVAELCFATAVIFLP